MDDPEIEVEQAPATVDAQDPLPESNFFYRRWFSYLLAIVNVAAMGYIVYKMQQPDSLQVAFYCVAALHWFTITYYMIAPSAEQLARIIEAARIAKTRETGQYNGGGYRTDWNRSGSSWGGSSWRDRSFNAFDDEEDYGPRSR